MTPTTTNKTHQKKNQNGLNTFDEDGITPIYAAAIGEKDRFGNYDPNCPVLEFLLTKDDISLLDKINALELAGAIIILSKKDANLAFRYWNIAMTLRQSERQEAFPKILPSSNRLSWRAVEWSTTDQLRDLQNSPFEYQMQAILVGVRILSAISCGALLKYLWGFILKYLRELSKNDRWMKDLDLCWVVLETVHQFDLRDNGLWEKIVTVTEELVYVLKDLQLERNALLSSEILQVSLELVSLTDRSHLEGVIICDEASHESCGLDHPRIVSQLVAILAGLPEMVNHETMCCLHRMVKRDGRNHFGENLLLLACQLPDKGDIPLESVRLLLKVGADPNAIDKDGNNPLHIILPVWEKRYYEQVAELLLASGTHPDKVNMKRETPLDSWKREWNSTNGQSPLTVPIWSTRKVTRLSCWSARSLRRNRIPYNRTDLPETLHDFVSMH